MLSTDRSGSAPTGVASPPARSPAGRSGATVDPLGQISAIEVRSAEVEVYEALRREIIHGLAPGTPLRLAPLATRFQVSTMPVRSAIARLEADGLVRQRPRRGATVTELTLDDFTDLYAIRMALEGVAARCGCTALTEPDMVRMRRLLQQMTALAPEDADVVDKYLALEWRLHDICYDNSRRPQLLRLVKTYRRNAERYFRLYLGDRLDVSIDVEHQAVFLAACEDRDGGGAEAAIRSLFDCTTKRVVPGLSNGYPNR